MGTCFIIQPFDNGQFDKRCREIIEPAIKDASLEPYRVDRDPNATIPIDKIHEEIEASQICIADITTDNPNVWYELGFAIACRKEVVLICAQPRPTNYPFDVRHRFILPYDCHTISDFENLRKAISKRIKALTEKEVDLRAAARMSSIATKGGLEQYEIAALITIAQRITKGVPIYEFERDMETVGFTAIAARLGVFGLTQKGMIEEVNVREWNDEYTALQATNVGMTWLAKNTELLKILVDPTQKKDSTKSEEPEFHDDGLPF